MENLRDYLVARWTSAWVIVCLVLLAIAASANAKEGSADAAGRIVKVTSEGALLSRQVTVEGVTERGALWLGCTFFPDTDRERDVQIEETKKHWYASGKFKKSFEVPINIYDLARGDREAEFAIALWRWKVSKSECRNGSEGKPCEYCMKNGYHMEGRVCMGRGVWSFGENKVLSWKDLSQAQEDARQAEESRKKELEARQAEASRRKQEETRQAEENRKKEEARQAELRAEEQRKKAEEARQAEERRKKEEEARQAQLRAEEQRKREDAARQVEEKRKREEEARQAELRAQEQRKREEAARQAEERQKQEDERRRQQEQAEARRNQTAPVGAAVTTITPAEMRKRGITEVSNRVVVVSVTPGSPAGRAGLRPGMVIISVSGRMMSGASDFPTQGRRGDTWQVDAVGEGRKIIQFVDSDFK